MGLIGDEYLKKIKDAEDSGSWDRVLYWLNLAQIEARKNYDVLNSKDYLPTNQRD